METLEPHFCWAELLGYALRASDILSFDASRSGLAYWERSKLISIERKSIMALLVFESSGHTEIFT